MLKIQSILVKMELQLIARLSLLSSMKNIFTQQLHLIRYNTAEKSTMISSQVSMVQSVHTLLHLLHQNHQSQLLNNFKHN